jgi:DNA replication and repair protein RecF
MVAPSTTGLPHYNVYERLMILAEIHLKNFRNHAQTSVNFGAGVNALLGNNGQGKTNILEGISYLGLTKSFYASGDTNVLQLGREEFSVDGTIRSDRGITHRVEIQYERTSGRKRVLVDGVQPETMASVIGRFPVVVLSPENSAITSGGPAERRRFLDIVLSQVSVSYLTDLLEYRKVLRQRNRILADAKASGIDSEEILAPWTEALVIRGGGIIGRRARFVAEFSPYVLESYRVLVNQGEQPEVRYSTVVEGPAEGEGIERALAVALRQRRNEERKRGLTLVGPHRDDLVFSLNGIGVQEYASQGQHKSFLVALKVAEFYYLRDRVGEVPMLLLDDIFSELDEHRAGNILRFVTSLGQAIITATDERVFHGSIPWNSEHRRFFVESGTCRAA